MRRVGSNILRLLRRQSPLFRETFHGAVLEAVHCIDVVQTGCYGEQYNCCSVIQ